MAKRLGVSEEEFHRGVKPAIITDFRSQLLRAGIRNPDIGFDEAGNIVLRDPESHAEIVTDVPLDSYGEK